jgi:hypothetical protein
VGGAGSGGPNGAGVAAARWLVNYLHLLRAEWWLPLAVAGLFCIQPVRTRRQVLLLAALLALPIFALRELEPVFRTGLPMLVPLAWGAGALLDRGLHAAFATLAPGSAARKASPGARRPVVRWPAILAAAFVLALPVGLEVGRSAGAIVAGFATRFDWALVVDQDDAREAAAYVNARTAPDDVVLVSPAVAWLYRGQTADFFQAVARSGDGVAFYPPAIPSSRFRVDPSPDAARYAVLDAYWDLWASQSPLVRGLAEEIERWPLEWSRGQTRVHRHP